MALAAVEAVVAETADEGVVVEAAVENVVAVAADERIVACVAFEGVVRVIAGDPVGKPVAGAGERRRAEKLEILDPIAERVGDPGENRIGPDAAGFTGRVARIVDLVRVVARAGENPLGPLPRERVVACAAVEAIGPRCRR